MSEVRAIFFDVGGVLLSNGWDRFSRREACKVFDLDWEDFQDRHEFLADGFERGQLTLDTYLDRTVFYRERSFDKEAFVAFMKRQSEPKSDSLAVLAELSGLGRYTLATLNNESRELNEYRIERFGLRDHFSMFLSSCYLGHRKPEPEIYQMAIDVSQQRAEHCVFVDDRELNLECAVMAGMAPVHFDDAEGLRARLAGLGVEWEGS